jgi:hypothetical protein
MRPRNGRENASLRRGTERDANGRRQRSRILCRDSLHRSKNHDRWCRHVRRSGAVLAADSVAAPFPAALARAEHDKGRTLLTLDGRPVAALVPLEDVEALEALEDARDAEAVREGLAEYDRDGANWPTYTGDELAARWGIDPSELADP